MENTIKIDNRRMNRELVAFVTPAEPDPTRSQQFHSWVNLTNGNAFGATGTPQEIAKEHGLAYLDKDQVAINRGADIRVRSYSPSEERPDLTSLTGEPLRTEISTGKGQNRRWQLLATEPGTVAKSVFPDNDIIAIHRDRVPKNQVVFYEAYRPREDDALQDTKGSARLLSGRSIRSEMMPQEFAFEHGFNHLDTKHGDNIAFNPRLHFTLEDVDPESIKSSTGSDRLWRSRLSWEGPTRELSGSKLLLSPEDDAAPVVFAREPQTARRAPRQEKVAEAKNDLKDGP